MNDPNGRLHDFVHLDPAGEVQNVNCGTESGFVTVGAQGRNPGPDWGLQIRLKTPKTHERYTSIQRDIVLP